MHMYMCMCICIKNELHTSYMGMIMLFSYYYVNAITR